MKIILQCEKSLSLTPDEIINMVDADRLAKLKETSQPILKAYVLASEGMAYPMLTDESGKTRKGATLWTKDTIKQIAHAVKSGITKLFSNHTDNTTYESAKGGKDRQPDAVVVASKIVHDSNTDYNVIVANFANDETAEKYDAVSIEVEYESMEQNGVSIIDKVIEVFGIALLGKGQKPAFEKALSLGVAHAQYAQYENEGTKEKKMDLSTVSIDELKEEFVVKRQFKVWQLFTPAEVFGTPRKLENGTIEYRGGDRDIEQFINDRVKESAISGAGKLKDAESQLQSLQEQIRKFEAVPVLQERIKEAKLPQIVIDSINANIKEFNPSEDIAKSADEFIASEKALYDKYTPTKEPKQISLGGSDETRQDDSVMGVDDAE